MRPPALTHPHAAVFLGDCLDVLAELPDASVDAIVTDPPYGLGFMGKAWDALPPGLPWAVECLRVLKPGGHLLAFGGTRTWHRLACAVEDAGFEVRDSIAWLYGSGFPKSLDVSKAIDKAAGTPDAQRWAGWGTALKPAFEPVVVARKPLAGTVAGNVLTHGTGALNIDGCRVAGAKPDTTRGASVKASSMAAPLGGQGRILDDGRGRWPANVVLDDTQAAELDAQTGTLRSGVLAAHHARAPKADGILGAYGSAAGERGYGDAGGASRFFPTFRYEAKAPTRERPRADDGTAHPTVKPLGLMRWLVRLVTPPGGTVLDTFAGSGTTLEAAVAEGFYGLGIDEEPAYLPLIAQRLARVAVDDETLPLTLDG